MSITEQEMKEESQTTSSNTQNTSSDLTLEYRSLEEEFINAYKNLPQLWDTEHEHYSNKYKRNDAFDVLLKVLRKYHPSANRYIVRKKINIARSNYRRALIKHLASKRIGENGEVIYDYIPTHWKFQALRFLDKNTDNNEIVQINIANNFEDEASNKGTFETEPTYDALQSIVDSEPLPQLHKKSNKRVKLEKKGQFFAEYDPLVDRELEAIGSNVICKLKRMKPEQRYHAELLINKVLISGLKDNLTDETDLTEVYK